MDPEIQRAIKTGRFTPVYLLYGEDDYSRDRAAEALARAMEQRSAGADTNVFDAAEAAVDDIASAVLTVPMFSGTRIVMVGRFDEMRTEDQARLVRLLLGGPKRSDCPVPPDTFVVILSGSKAAPRKEAQAGGENITVCEFRRAYERDARRFIFDHAREMGIKIDREAAELLYDLIGTDLRALAGEMDKLLLYVGPGRRAITEEDVRQAVGRGATRSVYDFCDAVADGDRARAASALKDLRVLSKASQLIQSVLAGHLRQLIEARDELDRGRSDEEVAQHITRTTGKPAFVARKIVAQARRLSQVRLARMVSRLARSDWEI
ncbi:MAG: DNA polymerase III subunit delta, partial [Firmicutes bacterium]|nr:DNA polymerase III subunit delta [Bacillota bacterium]